MRLQKGFALPIPTSPGIRPSCGVLAGLLRGLCGIPPATIPHHLRHIPNTTPDAIARNLLHEVSLRLAIISTIQGITAYRKNDNTNLKTSENIGSLLAMPSQPRSCRKNRKVFENQFLEVTLNPPKQPLVMIDKSLLIPRFNAVYG